MGVLILLTALAFANTAHAQDRGNPGVVMEMDSGLPLHTIYYPREAKEKLGIVAYGNGGCLNDGSNYQDLLSEVASRGYLVIANGAIQPLDLDNSTTAAQLTEAIDWATAENGRPGSKHEGKLDTALVAVMGHSCGGRQALIVSADPRVKTSIIVSAGGSPPEVLTKLHGPMLYLTGGPSDRAQKMVEHDVAAIAHVPVMKVELDVGHNGTLFEEQGGAFGRVINAWLAWRLRGAADGATWFVGTDCMLCTVSAWTLEKKGIE
jgi:dienelactone hydrolase